MPHHRKHSRGQVHLIRLYRIFFCALNGIIWCIWIWSHFAVTQQSCYNYARDVYHKKREMTGAVMYAIVALSLRHSLFKYATDHIAMICTRYLCGTGHSFDD